jgi:hypothetical protein
LIKKPVFDGDQSTFLFLHDLLLLHHSPILKAPG